MGRFPTRSLIVALVCTALLVSAIAALPADRMGVAGRWSVSMVGLTNPIVITTLPVGTSPFGVGYDPGNGYVFVANQGSNTVSVIDGTTVVATVRVGTQPRDIAYNPGNGDVYVANFGSNDVSVINGTTVVATIAVGTHPEGVAYNSGNGYVYVANTASNSVSVIDGTTVVATIPVGADPECVTYSTRTGYIFVGIQGSNSVSVIDGTTVVANISVGNTPEDVRYNSGNGYVYVANQESNTVSVIDGTTVVANISVGTHPEGIGYDSGNGYVYVSNYGSSTVSVIDGTTVVATVPVGIHPEGVGYDPGNGCVYVANSDSNSVSVIFAAPPTGQQFLVTFSATGLPTGTNWSVTLAGSTRSSTTSTIGFWEANGTYPYTVGPVSGYTAAPASGNVTVHGANVTQTIVFTSAAVATYTVTFTESGLASATSWSVALAGNLKSSTTSTIGFTEANGTYAYAVGGVSGYTSSPSSGSVHVAGAAQSVPITFTALPPGQYTVTFTESGLLSGTPFSVTLNGTTQSSSTTSLVFTEENGTYAYTVASVTGYAVTPASGSVHVAGAAQSVPITFTALPPAEYPVTFTQTGLPSGTLWSITLAGSTQSSNGILIWFSEVNGTYAFAVGSVPGYTSPLASGSVQVNGAPQSVTVAFAAIAPPPPSPSALGWYPWLVVLAIVVAAVVVLLALLRRRRKSPSPAPP